jgi:hypothetical protein
MAQVALLCVGRFRVHHQVASHRPSWFQRRTLTAVEPFVLGWPGLNLIGESCSRRAAGVSERRKFVYSSQVAPMVDQYYGES